MHSLECRRRNICACVDGADLGHRLGIIVVVDSPRKSIARGALNYGSPALDYEGTRPVLAGRHRARARRKARFDRLRCTETSASIWCVGTSSGNIRATFGQNLALYITCQ
jgi:hypothetical protein